MKNIAHERGIREPSIFPDLRTPDRTEREPKALIQIEIKAKLDM